MNRQKWFYKICEKNANDKSIKQFVWIFSKMKIACPIVDYTDTVLACSLTTWTRAEIVVDYVDMMSV